MNLDNLNSSEISELISKQVQLELIKRRVIMVEISARHVHLNESDLKTLFNKTHLTERRPLSQPNQFLSEERVTLVGSKGNIKNVAILGPARGATQVEISLTDARMLGLNPPINESGNLENACSIKIVSPSAEINSACSVIVAKRHVHLRPKDALNFGVSNNQIVKVRVAGMRAIIFDDVVARVSENFMPSMHIDFDEANAAGIFTTGYGEIIL